MCRYDRIFLEDLGELVVAANSLIALNDRARLLGPDAVDQRDHARLLSVLRRGIVKFDCTPIALGRGHTSLADKASALVFCWAVLLGGDMPSLQRFLSSFVAMTSDMGVEMGLSDFRLLSVKKLLPAYMVPASFDVDTMVVDNADKDAHDVGDVPDEDVFMANSLVVPGTLHIIHNLTKEIHLKLLHWKVFWKQLKSMEDLLCNRLRREQHPCMPWGKHMIF